MLHVFVRGLCEVKVMYSQRSLIRIDSDANKTSTDYFYDLRVNLSFIKKYKRIQNYVLRL